jgi:hypothetical protein
MSNEPSFWSDLFDWLVDRIAFNGYSELRRPHPKIESKDGLEPTIESLREEAREADAKLNCRTPNFLSSTDKKALDKEFWETI